MIERTNYKCKKCGRTSVKFKGLFKSKTNYKHGSKSDKRIIVTCKGCGGIQ